MFRIPGGTVSIFIACADALPLHCIKLLSFSKIPCETSAIFGRPMQTFYKICGCSAFTLHHIIQFCPISRAGRLAFSEDLCRFLSHLRMPCFSFTSYDSLIAVSYRFVHLIQVSTRKILALRRFCAYRVFDPRFVSYWPVLRT